MPQDQNSIIDRSSLKWFLVELRDLYKRYNVTIQINGRDEEIMLMPYSDEDMAYTEKMLREKRDL